MQDLDRLKVEYELLDQDEKAEVAQIFNTDVKELEEHMSSKITADIFISEISNMRKIV